MAHSTTIADLVKGQGEILTLRTKDTVNSALEKLAARNVTSAPVLDDNNKIWGFVDVVDLLMFLVKVASKEQHTSVSPPSIDLSTDDLGVLAKRSGEFALTSLVEILSSKTSRHDPYYPLHGNQGIKEAVTIFLKGVHRIAVTDNSNKIVNILTQSNIIKYLSEDTTRLGLNAEKEVGKINLLQKELVTVDENTKTIDAFKLMVDKRVSCVGVVDSHGILISSLSSTDLKGLREFQFMRLLFPVTQFIAEIRKEQNRKYDYVVKCTPETPIKRAVAIVTHEHVHRIFIVDSHNKPVSVLTLTDLLNECFH